MRRPRSIHRRARLEGPTDGPGRCRAHHGRICRHSRQLDRPQWPQLRALDLRRLEALDFAILHAEELGYILPHQDRLNRLVVERQIQLTPQIQWHLHLGDFSELIQAQKYAAPNAIFYDPYSAKGNSEMWTLETFTSLFRALDPEVPCTLTNYTRSTSVRVALLLAGFYVGTGCIIGEKNETTFAANELALVCQPLDRSWLKRVRNSTNAAPLHRGAGYSLAAISASDFALLESRPQFSR